MASKKGRTEIKIDSSSVIHFNVGKASFTADQLIENTKSVIKTIIDSKPEGIKGRLMKKASISTSMSQELILVLMIWSLQQVKFDQIFL